MKKDDIVLDSPTENKNISGNNNKSKQNRSINDMKSSSLKCSLKVFLFYFIVYINYCYT